MALEIIGTAQAAAWVPEVWAQAILLRLRNYSTLALLVNRDYDSELAAYGNTVNIPLPPLLTAKDVGNPDPDSNTTLATVSVTLNRHKEVNFAIGDVAKAQSKPQIMADLVDAAAVALADVVESDLMALTAAVTATVGVGGTAVNDATLRAARKRLVDNKAPKNAPFSGVFSTADYSNIMGLPLVTSVNQSGTAETLRTGKIPQLYGIQPYESQLVPTLAPANPTHSTGLVFHKNAFALVTRPLEMPMATAQSVVVNDTDSGLSFRMTLVYNQKLKRHEISVDILYGVAILRQELAVKVFGAA